MGYSAAGVGGVRGIRGSPPGNDHVSSGGGAGAAGGSALGWGTGLGLKPGRCCGSQRLALNSVMDKRGFLLS